MIWITRSKMCWSSTPRECRLDREAKHLGRISHFPSRSSTKFSRHVIFQTKDPFLDNLAVGKFVNLILEDLHGCLINHQCPAMLDGPSLSTQPLLSYTDSIVFARNLLVSLESRLARFANCQCSDDYSQLRFQDLVQFIVKKNHGNGLAWFCDMGMTKMLVQCQWSIGGLGVYTKNRAFRLLRSSKFDKKECFTVAAENQWKPTLRHPRSSTDAERQTFQASLVYFNRWEDRPVRDLSPMMFLDRSDVLSMWVTNSFLIHQRSLPVDPDCRHRIMSPRISTSSWSTIPNWVSLCRTSPKRNQPTASASTDRVVCTKAKKSRTTIAGKFCSCTPEATNTVNESNAITSRIISSKSHPVRESLHLFVRF